MKPVKIYYPTSLEKVNTLDDNIDVIVTLEDGVSYVLVVGTPKNIYTLMKRHGEDFLSAGGPIAFVTELTCENINKLVESFCEGDAYWLKYYHNAGEDNYLSVAKP